MNERLKNKGRLAEKQLDLGRVELKIKSEDFEEMAELLSSLKANFILSINDREAMRRVFKAFDIKPVTLKYTVSKGRQRVGKELLITNN